MPMSLSFSISETGSVIPVLSADGEDGRRLSRAGLDSTSDHGSPDRKWGPGAPSLPARGEKWAFARGLCPLERYSPHLSQGPGCCDDCPHCADEGAEAQPGQEPCSGPCCTWTCSSCQGSWTLAELFAVLTGPAVPQPGWPQSCSSAGQVGLCGPEPSFSACQTELRGHGALSSGLSGGSCRIQ